MNFNHLRILAAVADSRSLTKASELLRISQPSVSVQLKVLQEELGVTLFRRHGRKLSLTEIGRSCVDDIKPILNQLESLKKKCMAKDKLGSTLIVGGCPATSSLILPKMSIDLRKRFSGLRIYLHTGTSKEIRDLVIDGDIEIAVVVNPPDAAQICKEEFRMEEIVFFVRPRHPLTRFRRLLLLSDILRYGFATHIGKNRNDTITQYLNEAADLSFSRNTIFCQSAQAIKTAVRSSDAVGILYKDAVSADLRRGDFQPLKIHKLRAAAMSYVVYSQKKDLSVPARYLLDLLRSKRKRFHGKHLASETRSPIGSDSINARRLFGKSGKRSSFS